MQRFNTRSGLCPWIESLIQSYGSEEESSNGGRLKAYVTSVGQMSQSQACNAEGPTGLLFLSDGVMQIPAILTSSAWERLQERDDRECFSSLLNTTVCLKDYQLQFHMAVELTRCRFFLSVGDMLTTSAGSAKDNTPCCTTLPAIQQKISKTWRMLTGQATQESQTHMFFDLSELLGEWQHETVQKVLEDVRETLMTVRNLQPSTSTDVPQVDMFAPTSWDIERVRYNEAKCPLIPEGEAILEQTSNADFLKMVKDGQIILSLSESSQSPVDTVDGQTAKSPEREQEIQNSGCNITHQDDTHVDFTKQDIIPLNKPWEMFPLPNGSSFLDGSQEAFPLESIQPNQENCGVNVTSNQLPITSTQLNDLQHSKGDHGSLPPYQKLPLSSDSSNTPTPNGPTASQDKHTSLENVDTPEGTVGRKAKRKRECLQEPPTDVAVEEEEAQINGSPPSWLFESEMGSGTSEGDVQTLCVETRKVPTVHIDGKPFDFTYMTLGQNLQDFSRFKVSKSLLSWAIKYLVAPKTDKTSCD
ncbi:adrenocortical dysplasia protein homolog [Corythoichthys intestinalis]|uniref:adrenocortical dysplasia protein homolog n=1 Tax=Corythoichthys intestinalis TaxID=161448 RepID=UPI0025A6366F|nr:adrenocortical dysplasia protein homolog [Corythoichthys intestinalis]XP_057693173.1 adrenocortical dysplasia protein homolog [Corythoichthys intestinalis]